MVDAAAHASLPIPIYDVHQQNCLARFAPFRDRKNAAVRRPEPYSVGLTRPRFVGRVIFTWAIPVNDFLQKIFTSYEMGISR